MKYLLALTTLAIAVSPAVSVAVWGQCGVRILFELLLRIYADGHDFLQGIGYTGSTVCDAGSTCTFSSACKWLYGAYLDLQRLINSILFSRLFAVPSGNGHDHRGHHHRIDNIHSSPLVNGLRQPNKIQGTRIPDSRRRITHIALVFRREPIRYSQIYSLALHQLRFIPGAEFGNR